MAPTRLSNEPVVRLKGILTHLIPREHDAEGGAKEEHVESSGDICIMSQEIATQ